jgi:integrase/recombinase XerD
MAQAKSLTQQDIDAVLTHIASRTHATRNRLMFLFTVLAGLRVSEVAQLMLGDMRNTDGSIKTQMFLSAQRVKYDHALR